MQYVFQSAKISFFPKYIKLMFRGVFLHTFAYANAGS